MVTGHQSMPGLGVRVVRERFFCWSGLFCGIIAEVKF